MIAHFVDTAIGLTIQFPLIAQGAKQAGIDKLDGATRARVLAALASLIILGFGLVLLAWMAGRFTRRYMGSGPSGPSQAIRTEEWVRRSNEDELKGPPVLPPPD